MNRMTYYNKLNTKLKISKLQIRNKTGDANIKRFNF